MRKGLVVMLRRLRRYNETDIFHHHLQIRRRKHRSLLFIEIAHVRAVAPQTSVLSDIRIGGGDHLNASETQNGETLSLGFRATHRKNFAADELVYLGILQRSNVLAESADTLQHLLTGLQANGRRGGGGGSGGGGGGGGRFGGNVERGDRGATEVEYA